MAGCQPKSPSRFQSQLNRILVPGGFTNPAATMTLQNATLSKIESIDTAPTAGYDEQYLRWKGWDPDAFARLDPRQAADFRAMLRKAGANLPVASPVLEIGFGNGMFLEYGRRQQWTMQGTEANAGLVERARRDGFAATQSETLSGFAGEQFALVAAFDVMEHIPLAALPAFLCDVRRVLRPGGIFLARFPNGDSPFGRHIQNGDVTHQTCIGSIRGRYLATQTGFDINYLGMEPQALLAGRAHTPHRMLALPIKMLMNAFLNLIFSPRDPLPFCSPNLVMALRKPDRVGS